MERYVALAELEPSVLEGGAMPVTLLEAKVPLVSQRNSISLLVTVRHDYDGSGASAAVGKDGEDRMMESLKSGFMIGSGDKIKIRSATSDAAPLSTKSQHNKTESCVSVKNTNFG